MQTNEYASDSEDCGFCTVRIAQRGDSLGGREIVQHDLALRDGGDGRGESPGGDGGGVYMASGTPICRNTLIVGNRTDSQPGAGAYVVAGTLENCTVVGNYMTSSTNAAWSSGIYAWEGAKIVNCISDANLNGETAINAGAEDGVATATAYKYSCLPGFTLGGTGCTTTDPLLDDGYKPSAPEVLGKGKNADWMKTALDLEGNPRKQGSRVDMGCYECDAKVSGMMLLIR